MTKKDQHSVTNYQETYQNLPTEWYENDAVTKIILVASFLASSILFEPFSQDKHGLVVLASIIVYILGSLKDKISTEHLFAYIQKHPELAEVGIRETSIFLPDQPTKAEIYSHLRNIPEYMFVAISALLPATGIAIGTYRYLASLSNDQITKKLELVEKEVN